MRRKRPPTGTNPHRPFVRPIAPGAPLLAPVVAGIFQELRISVAVWTKRRALPEEWYPINVAPSITSFEVEQSVLPPRYAYNYRCFERVLRAGAPLLGTHAGFSDLFVPIDDTTEVRRVLVAGPFATSHATASEIVGRYYAIARSRGRLSDPAFAQYVAATLSTLTLEGSLLGAFQRLLASFGALVSGVGDPSALAAEAEAMRLKLFEARFSERMWEAARGLVDDWKTRTLPAIGSEPLAYLGVHRVPRHVLVGSLIAVEKDPDPLALLLRCHSFQRACAATARKVGNMLAGQAGDHGVFFLADFAGSRARTISKLRDLATRAAASARRFGLRLHAGADVTVDATLPARYRSALANAERAADQGVLIVYDEPLSGRPDRALAKLRYELARGIEARPDLLDARFENYIETALALTGNRIESLRHELDAGLERFTEPLLATGAFDEKGFDGFAATRARAVARATTTAALIAPYRKFILDIRGAVEHSIGARQERGTQRAVAFIREHLSEQLTLSQVARLAGFAPGYFSKLFKQNEGTTFQRYLLALRLERAAEMLKGTKLGIERVRQLSGFRNRAYFNRAFKKAMGVSPRDHRRRFNARLRRVAGYEPRHPAGTLSS